ncbi:MAG: spermidine/putrescine ABC transporter substrate-binding protein [Chloroflexota bacterium]|nr:spermidine/putrescine ABC transporter substrate-binding protein [Chloroflexota bacterium]
MGKQVRGIAVALLMGMLVVGRSAAQEETDWECPSGFEGQTLRVYNWDTYIADGTIALFEDLCAVTVIYDVFETNVTLIDQLIRGAHPYDVVVPSDYVVADLIRDGLLYPLDHRKIPNIANLDPQFLNTPYDPDNAYALMYQWGSIGIGYHRGRTGKAITSWADVFAYPGAVVWLDEARTMVGSALQMLDFDPNSQNPDEIAAAAEFLIARSDNVIAIAPDTGQDYLVSGEADIVIEYNGDIFQLNDDCGCDDYAYVLPEEGSSLFADYLVIPANAPNPDLGHVFIDYLLDPYVGAAISNYTAYGTPNRAALDMGLIDAELLANPGIYPPDDVRAQLFFIESSGDAELDYLVVWDEIFIQIGQ